jgi:hypothetical protein
VAYRASYGADFYGTGLYGVTGAINGSATVTVTSSVSASAQVVKESTVTIAASASVTVSADVLSDALINIFLTSSVSANAEKYAQTDGYRTGYGLRTYGTSIYGENVSVEAGLVAISATSSLTASANVTAVGAATIAATSNVTAVGEGSVTGAVNIAMNSTLVASSSVTRNGSSAIAITASLAASGRFKWEPVLPTPEIWTPITDSRAA